MNFEFYLERLKDWEFELNNANDILLSEIELLKRLSNVISKERKIDKSQNEIQEKLEDSLKNLKSLVKKELKSLKKIENSGYLRRNRNPSFKILRNGLILKRRSQRGKKKSIEEKKHFNICLKLRSQLIF